MPIIMSKLTTEVRHNLAREHSNSQWVLSDLMAALQKEIRILESGLHDPYNPSSTLMTTGAFQIGARGRGVNNSGKRKGPLCIFCKGAHPTHTCESVTEHQKRLEIVQREKLCFNCLAHHKVSQFQSKFRCKKCKKRHHTTLCNSEPPSAEPTSDKVTEKASSGSSADVTGLLTPASPCAALHTVTTCLLKTAVAPIIAGSNRTKANILFDEGAQRSFISIDMVNKLGISPNSTTDNYILGIIWQCIQTSPEALGCNSRGRDKHWKTNSHISTHCGHDCCTHPECRSHIRQYYATFEGTQVIPSSYI